MSEWSPERVRAWSEFVREALEDADKDLECSDEVPDVIGTVRAYRRWALRDGQLYPLHYPARDAWASRRAEAVCRWNFAGPTAGCNCGIYACTSPHSSELHRQGIFGVIECSGAIVEHEKNDVIRAQKAEIAALCIPYAACSRHTVRLVQERYPGVMIYRSRTMMLKAFPPAERTPRSVKRLIGHAVTRYFRGPWLCLGLGLCDLEIYVFSGHDWVCLMSAAWLLTLGGAVPVLDRVMTRRLNRQAAALLRGYPTTLRLGTSRTPAP
jgi:hypothetical protein